MKNNQWMLWALLLGGLFLFRRSPTAWNFQMPTGMSDPETVRLAEQAGVSVGGFWDRPASETGAWY